MNPADNVLRVVYDHGPVENAFESFDELKARVQREWKATPKLHDPVGPEMRAKVGKWIRDFDIDYAEMMADIDRSVEETKAKARASSKK